MYQVQATPSLCSLEHETIYLAPADQISYQTLQEHSIGALINLSQISLETPEQFPTLHLPCIGGTRSLARDIPKCLSFMESHLKKGHKVLLVCQTGQYILNILLVYYMAKYGWDYPQALDYLTRKLQSKGYPVSFDHQSQLQRIGQLLTRLK